jgi:hypothetical protein
MLNVATMTDAELDAEIGAAVLDGSKDLEELEAERGRRHAATSRQRLAAAEAQRRAAASCASERDHLLVSLGAQLDELQSEYHAALEPLDTHASHEAFLRAYTLGRQVHALSHALAGVTGRRKWCRPFSATDQIALRGGQAGLAFVRRLGTPPTVPTPWRGDLERLRAVWEPRQGITSLT